jgi:D-3-phosphoglycerate dehydrogenase
MVSPNNWKVLVCDPVDELLIISLKKKGISVEYNPSITPDQLKESIRDFQVLVLRSRTKLTSEILSSASNLRIIARAGIGTDNIDTDFAEKLGISVVTAAGSSTHSVAELNVSLMISLARNLHALISMAKNGVWKKIMGTELYGRTAGIIGMGRIGASTAQIVSSMGMKVLAYDPVVNQELIEKFHFEYADLGSVLSRSDVIFILANLTGGGRDMIDSTHFASMKDRALLINTSRPEFIRGTDLLYALRSGKIGGYATDVFWHEPPIETWEKEMLSMDNVIVTPHIGAQTHEAQRRVAEYTLNNLLKKIEEM